MRRPALVLLGFLMSFGVTAAKAQTPGTASKPATGAPSSSVAPKPVHLPLFFEANRGQTDSQVRFMARGKGYTLLLTPTETILAESKTRVSTPGKAFAPFQSPLVTTKASGGSVIRMQLVGANSSPAMTGLGELPGKVNYLIGNDPSKWQTHVALYSQARTEQVYPGVDLLFHGDEKQLEYDFVVAPGADPSKIAFRIRGAARTEIDAHGDLVLHGTDSDFVMHKPVIYQTIAAERHPIEGSFVKKGKNEVAFRLGAYDHSQELVIDPAIGFSSFLGGNFLDISSGFAVDDSTPGSPKLYLSGITGDSTTFPEPFKIIGSGTSMTPPDLIEVGFIAKVDPTMTGAASLDYLTFIGGSTPNLSTQQGCISGFTWLALDKSQGAANIEPVVGGTTNCSNFPGPTGTATVLHAVTGTGSGNGDPNPPIGAASLVARIKPGGAAIDQAAILGGNSDLGGGFVAVGNSGDVILTGETEANDLPTKNAYVNTFDNDASPTPFDDCFVTILNRADLSINYLTYLNVGEGSSSTIGGVGCGAFEDASGNILAGGNTFSTTAFNLGPGGTSLANGFQTTFQGTRDTFAMKLNTSLVGTNQLLYATYFGGGGDTRAGNGSLDLGNGVVAIVGSTTSNSANGDIPLKNAFQTKNSAAGMGMVGYLVLINTTQTGAASLQCGTYFGGSGGDEIVSAVTYDAGDPTNYRIILGGRTNSATDFPTLNPIQPYVGGVVNGVQSPDAFLSILRVPTPNQTAFNATLVFSTYIGGSNPPAQIPATQGVAARLVEDDRISAVAVDANHTIYAVGATNAPGGFFANTNPTTTVNGFQTTCSSCNLQSPLFPLDDAVVFSIGTGSNATLQSIAVAPTSASIAVGQTQQFSAVGNFNDGTEKDITSLVTWTTVPTGFATMSTTSPGLATGTAVGSTAITPALGTATVLNTGALTVTGGATATHFSVTAPANATAGTTFNITVTALDASNNVVTNYAGTVHFTSSDTQAVLPANSALLNGVGTFPAVLHTAGAQTIAATDTVTASITGTSGTVTVAGATGAALTITKSGPATATLNTQAHYTIVITNNGPAAATGISMNDPIPGPNNPPGFDAAVPGCFISNQIETTIYAVGCSFSSPLASGSSITIPYHVTYMSNGTFTNTATVSGTNNTSTNNSASATTTVGGAAAATHFSVMAPGTAMAGTAFNVTVTALDASNAVVTGYTGTVHFTSSDGAAVLPANSTLTNGVGTFSVTLKTAGAQTIAATDTVTASITGVSGSVTVSAAATATHFSVTAPASATAGTAFNITVTALTAANATATGYTGTVHFTSSDGAAVLPANSALLNGVGTFPVVLHTAGAQTIAATDTVTGSITGVSGTITVAGVGPAPMLSITKTHTGNFTQGQQGAQYSLTVANASGAGPTSGNGTSATVQSTGSIYATGGGSTPPTMVTLPSGATSVAFNSVTGSITTGCASTEGCIVLNNGTGNNNNDPDGVGAAPATSSNTGTSSISGMIAPGAGYLVGLFVPAGGPAGTAPAALDFTSSGLGTSFTSLSPQLDQVFFIGDGLTGDGTGTQQTFNIPTGAGQLWLGISDAGGYVGAPGAYGDNLGTYTVGFTLNAPGSGGVTVTETAPSGLTLVSMAGTGWACGSPNAANVCTRSDALAGGASYPVITVAVNVAADATSPQVNTAGVTGGGSAPANASDSTVIESASTAATHFSVTAPATAAPGTPINFTVTALDASNATATGYAGTVHFTSSDDGAVLPVNSTLTDGVGTFAGDSQHFGQSDNRCDGYCDG